MNPQARVLQCWTAAYRLHAWLLQQFPEVEHTRLGHSLVDQRRSSTPTCAFAQSHETLQSTVIHGADCHPREQQGKRGCEASSLLPRRMSVVKLKFLVS